MTDRNYFSTDEFIPPPYDPYEGDGNIETADTDDTDFSRNNNNNDEAEEETEDEAAEVAVA